MPQGPAHGTGSTSEVLYWARKAGSCCQSGVLVWRLEVLGGPARSRPGRSGSSDRLLDSLLQVFPALFGVFAGLRWGCRQGRHHRNDACGEGGRAWGLVKLPAYGQVQSNHWNTDSVVLLEVLLPALSITGRETEAEEEQGFALSEATTVRPMSSSVAPALKKRLNLAPTPPGSSISSPLLDPGEAHTAVRRVMERHGQEVGWGC